MQRERCGVKKTLDALRIQKALDKSRTKVVAVKARKLVGKLEHDFSSGRGEAEAIALAAVKQGPCVIWSLVEGCCWPLKNTATEKFRWAELRNWQASP